jgi:hypothetical protein
MTATFIGGAYCAGTLRSVLLGEGTNALSNVVELAVGVACLLAGGGLWRRPGVRWVAVLLVIAGSAAIIHAVAAIV